MFVKYAQVHQDRPTLKTDLLAEASQEIVDPTSPLARVVGPRAPIEGLRVLPLPSLAVRLTQP
eukprot:9281834-Pyramimonas_sp.AAC.1